MILMIDNYDSFTFNLVQYLQALGAQVRVERNDALDVDAIAKLAPEKIVISPGPCTPNEAGVSLELVATLGPRVPILGVCLGHQAIGQVRSEEHTSELQSLMRISYAVFCLKKKKKKQRDTRHKSE